MFLARPPEPGNTVGSGSAVTRQDLGPLTHRVAQVVVEVGRSAWAAPQTGIGGVHGDRVRSGRGTDQATV